MKKQEKIKLSDEVERRFNEVRALRKELFKLFGDKMAEHHIDMQQALTLMVAVAYDVANVVVRRSDISLGLVLMDFKHGLDVFYNNEERKNQK